MTLAATDRAATPASATAPLVLTRPGARARGVRLGRTARHVVHLYGLGDGAALYAHYALHGVVRATVALGAPAPGRCGELRTTIRALPVAAPPSGEWVAQYDTSRVYDRHATPRARLAITVGRTTLRYH